MNKKVLSVLVDNTSGVLNRVAAVSYTHLLKALQIITDIKLSVQQQQTVAIHLSEMQKPIM